MLQAIQKLTLLAAGLLLAYLAYLGFFHNEAQAWQNFRQPQMAAFTTLEQDEQILEDLRSQIHFSQAKPLNPDLLVKPSIFERVER